MVEQKPDGNANVHYLITSSPRVYLQPFSLLMMESMYRSCSITWGIAAFDLPHRLLDSGGNVTENDDISEVVFDIRRGQDSPG